MSHTSTTMPGSTQPRTDPARRATNRLLACGAVAGPLFLVLVFLQVVTRAGFDPTRHAMSQLSLGGLGWIQTANFIVAGLLLGAAAAGIRRALRGSRGGTWGPILIGSFAACLVWAGVFVTDPAEGFPPGTPDGAAEVSWHGLLHSFAPALAFLALIAACFVFARRFASRRQRGWAAYCLATGIALVTPDLFFGRALFVPVLGFAAVLGWGWVSIVAARLIAESRSR